MASYTKEFKKNMIKKILLNPDCTVVGFAREGNGAAL